jgi:16S rRNA (uracil1498-N3)-methyltransferase
LTANQNYDKISIVVGPEGGISDDEEELLVNQGFTRVSLGDRIMRVETVPIFILSALNYEFME